MLLKDKGKDRSDRKMRKKTWAATGRSKGNIFAYGSFLPSTFILSKCFHYVYRVNFHGRPKFLQQVPEDLKHSLQFKITWNLSLNSWRSKHEGEKEYHIPHTHCIYSTYCFIQIAFVKLRKFVNNSVLDL